MPTKMAPNKPPTLLLVPKQSNQPSSSSKKPLTPTQSPAPKPLTWYEIVVQKEQESSQLEQSSKLSIEQLVELDKANPTLMGLEIFQKAIAEFFEKGLQ